MRKFAFYCRITYNGEVASIHSMEENEVVQELCEGDNYKIGVVRENGSLGWSDGSPMDFENWKKPHDVNNQNMTHAYVNGTDGKWELMQ